MKYQAFIISVFACLFLNGASVNLFSQNINPPTHLQSKEDSLQVANKLMIAKQSRKALAITSRMMVELKNEGKFNSPFGLKVRLVHGSAMIHADMNRTSFDFLWELKDDSKANNNWVVYAETCRVIASILEYSGRAEQALENLRTAQRTIRQHQLDSIYPHFAVRISSWHRGQGNRDSSIFYAEEAIRTGKQFGKIFEQAEGHLLLGINYSRTDTAKAIAHYKTGAELYRKVEEYSTFCNMHISLSRFALGNKNPNEAKAHIDTAFTYLPRTNDNNIGQLHWAYTAKADVFQQMGLTDSAFYYLKKGHALHLDHVRAENLDKVVEIDNKYNVEKKTEELGVEKARRNLLLTIAAIIVLFSVILAFYFLKLKEANKLTIIQSEQLKNLDAAKSRFFANVSHELRTPLTLMTGTINSLQKEDGLNDKQERMLQIAQRGGKQLEVLVNEILDLGKMDAGKLEVIREPVKLALFFDNYFSQFESLAERKSIQYNFETWVTADVEAKIDKEKCRQIVYNLLSNAFKFTQQGQSVRAIINVENDVLELEVTDTGDGIHPDDQPQIFDRYFQTSQKDTSAMGGTGIGLAICQEYAKLMGGQMKMKSIFGKGTSFRLILPIEISSTNKGTTGSAPPNVQSIPKSDKSTVKPEPLVLKKTPVISENPTNKPSILIVEDNPELQDYISMVLQDRYHLITADNGQEALDIINGKRTIDNGQLIPKAMSSTLSENPSVDNFQLSIDLILSDLMMPIMDGYQLLEKLKQNEATSHIPVIMLTARADSSDRLKALRIGVDDYMSKPFDEEELRVRIENLLKNQAVRKDVVIEQEESPKFSEQDKDWLEKFESYVKENFDSDILDVTKMASDFAMSKSTLLRQLKRLTGLSPKNYLLEMRLNKARLLLESKTYNSIAKIASEVGYKDARSFSKGFKKRFGKLPSEYLGD